MFILAAIFQLRSARFCAASAHFHIVALEFTIPAINNDLMLERGNEPKSLIISHQRAKILIVNQKVDSVKSLTKR